MTLDEFVARFGQHLVCWRVRNRAHHQRGGD